MSKSDSLFLSNESDNLFFSNEEIDQKIQDIVDEFRKFSKVNSQQVYVIKKPLGSSFNFDYDINDIVLVLIPKYPILILSYGNYSEEQLDEYEEDLKHDLGILASKYKYNEILGRSRKWSQNLIKIEQINDFNISNFLEKKIEQELVRKVDLLISLLIGSINNISRIGIDDPQTTLDQLKQKIVLFDGKQSKFIYSLDSNKKDITIQGMAGTGKTELLLYKLKEIFINEKDAKIAFTCYNKVLASEMKKRIPAFFNAMKIEEQIQWDEKMYVFSSWGKSNDIFSGMYRYICSFYKVAYYTYSQNSDFDDLCKSTINSLDTIDNFKPCFDYVFIDESQDFGKHFFELCKKVTNNQVFIAGDIFQNIFDNNFDENIAPDYLLYNCYRTDPRTLMIAHSIGLGLCEQHPISWLADSGWIACGYQIKREDENRKFKLTRNRPRHFEDIQTEKTFELKSYKREDLVTIVLRIINEIKNNNPTVQPDDIAVIIISNFNTVCSIANKIEYGIGLEIGWECVKGYETKEKKCDRLFISNMNNIKGLEFPFIICIVEGSIGKNISYRNSIYMALTRSFLTSYFLVEDVNKEFIDLYDKANLCIKNKGYLELREPTDEEIQEMRQNIIEINLNTNSSISFILDELINQYENYLSEEQEQIIRRLGKTLKRDSIEIIKEKMEKIIKDLIETNEKI